MQISSHLFALFAFCAVGPLQADGPSVIYSPSTLVYPDFWHTPLGVHRGTPKLLKLLLGDKVEFNDPQGLACTRMKDIHLIEGAGHWVQQEQPDEVNRLLLKFLKEQ